jgi:transcription initiation factor TFIIIB Brf1 subunit/transcription initiation factor TFIIB
LILSQNKDRLDGGLSYLNLPQSICNTARQLLPEVVDAFGQAEALMQVSPATVAAIIYIAARQEGRALSLGTAASAMDVSGPEVYREFRWGRSSLHTPH